MMKYPITVNGRSLHVNVSTACTMLELWMEGLLTLTYDEFEELNDALVELISVARDEKYRLEHKP